MLGDSKENLFGGINATIMEALKKVTSVSDTQYDDPSKLRLDDDTNVVITYPPIDRDHLSESEADLIPVKGLEAWKKKVESAGLKTEENKNKVDAKDGEGNLHGWYNKATDMGYVHKDLKVEMLKEEASHLQMLYAIHNAIDKTEKDGSNYSDNIAHEMSKCGMNPHNQEDHNKLNEYVKDLTNGAAQSHHAYAAKRTSGKLEECKVEALLEQAEQMVNQLAEELTDAQKEKREEFVMKLKKSADDFKSRYGDEWESVLYATATKMAKNAK